MCSSDLSETLKDLETDSEEEGLAEEGMELDIVSLAEELLVRESVVVIEELAVVVAEQLEVTDLVVDELIVSVTEELPEGDGVNELLKDAETFSEGLLVEETEPVTDRLGVSVEVGVSEEDEVIELE